MSKLSMLGDCVKKSWIAGGIAIILNSCASTSYTYKYPASSDLHELIMEWDAIERSVGKCQPEYREQYTKALKELNNSISETERWRSRAEQ
jgi:hypothetical protein